MIIYQDSLMELRLEADTDILKVQWHNHPGVTESDTRKSYDKLIAIITEHRITRLLIDSRPGLSPLPDEEYFATSIKLALDLATTPVKKVARIVSSREAQEGRAKQFVNYIRSRISMRCSNKEFRDKKSAKAWLIRDLYYSPELRVKACLPLLSASIF